LRDVTLKAATKSDGIADKLCAPQSQVKGWVPVPGLAVFAVAGPSSACGAASDSLPGFSSSIAAARAELEHGISRTASMASICRPGASLASAQPAETGSAVEWSAASADPTQERPSGSDDDSPRMCGVLGGGDIAHILEQAARARVAAARGDDDDSLRHALALLRAALPETPTADLEAALQSGLGFASKRPRRRP